MRSSTGRRAGSSRAYSLNPGTLPTDHLPARFFFGFPGHYGPRPRNSQHALEFVREDLDEVRNGGFPVLDDPLALRAAGKFGVGRDQAEEHFDVLRFGQRLDIDIPRIAAGGKIPVLV